MSSSVTCASCGAPLKDVGNEGSIQPCEVCGNSKRSITITVPPIEANLSPFAFQYYARDFYDAYKKVKGGPRFSPARLTLLAQSVELAAKSLHVHQGKRDVDLRKLGHDLVKACDATILSIYGIAIAPDEASELIAMNELNKAKAFEYFWFSSPGMSPEMSGLTHALTGRKGLPNEDVVESILLKLLAPKM